MRVGSDRVQFAAVTAVALVVWTVVTLAVPRTPIPESNTTMVAVVASSSRVPTLAMALAAASFVGGWVTLNWSRPRRWVTLSLLVLGTLVVATPFFYYSFFGGTWHLLLGIIAVAATLSVIPASPPASLREAPREGTFLTTGDAVRLFGTLGFVLLLWVVPGFLVSPYFPSMDHLRNPAV